MLRAFWLAAIAMIGTASASAQGAMPGTMDLSRPQAPNDDDTLIVTQPDRNNPARMVRCGEGSYQQIISDCSEILEVRSLDRRRRAAVFLTRATARYWLRQYPEAIRDYDQALGLEPGNLNAVLGRAMAYRESRQFAPAIADFDTAIRMKSDWADLYLHRAVARAEAGDNAKALADIDSALALEPGNAIARLNRNIVQYRLEIAARAPQ